MNLFTYNNGRRIFMNNNQKFKTLREKYPDFIYEKYDISQDEENMILTFYFDIPGLTSFEPKIKIKKKNILNDNVKQEYLSYFVFHIGLIESISYFKCTCSPNIKIKAGYINEEQISWLKKLYYNGLGEFLYTNQIEIGQDDLCTITCESKELKLPKIEYEGRGNLIPVGGGKDSCVSLEILKNEENNTCFVINPKVANVACCEIAGYDEKHSFFVERILDRKIIELNQEGFLNGHTPFSSIVAFISYLCCYLSKNKNIVLSNEASANEATVLGTNINHQYSKTYEFETDFNNYTEKYFGLDIHYFSLLRGLSEFEIGRLFSRYKKYHHIFKSCNVGSKEKNWNWCCNCPKCLFVYLILSPFLYKDELVSIFGEDLFEKEELLETFKELLGYADTKPFECVGTFEEARYAVSLTIESLKNKKLPFLLDYYKNHYPLELNGDEIKAYNELNHIEKHLEELVKEELIKNV